MGQIFMASAYDIESKTCCTFYADKFHANCYSYSDAVISMHYLLRKKPYRIMWGGDYVFENIQDIKCEEDLQGISTFLDYDFFEMNINDLANKDYYEKIKFIGDNNKTWKHFSVEDESIEYFNIDVTNSVSYIGYLVNHTKKLAVNLADYYEKSVSIECDIEMAIDLLPALTETGGGIIMALDGFVTLNTTEDLAGKWCGDLLEIVDTMPEGYEIINCCFSRCEERTKYCYTNFGKNRDGLLLNDKNGTLYNGIQLGFFGDRGMPCNFLIKEDKHTVYFKPIKSKDIDFDPDMDFDMDFFK